MLSIHVDGRLWVFARARQGNPYVCMLGLARPVYNTPHDGNFQIFYARMDLFPEFHLLQQVLLNLLCQLLKEGTGRPTADQTDLLGDRPRKLQVPSRMSLNNIRLRCGVPFWYYGPLGRKACPSRSYYACDKTVIDVNIGVRSEIENCPEAR